MSFSLECLNTFEWIVPVLRIRTLAIIALTFILAFSGSGKYLASPAKAIGLANVVATNVYWGSNPLDPSTAHPGDVNVQLSIVLTNVGDDVARSVNATLYLAPPITYTYYSGAGQYNATSVSQIAGDMAASQSFTLTFTVSIDSNAKEDIYRYSLELAYKSARELQNIDRTVAIDIPVWRGELHVQGVVTLPTKIYPDSKQVLLKVSVVNSGRGTAKDTQLVLELMQPFTASSSGSDRIFVGNIPTGQSTEADFIIDVAANAPFGQYSVILAQESGNQLIPIGGLPIYVAEKVNFEIVSVNPTVLHAGDSGDVIGVTIRNAGTVKADSVRVQLRVGNFFTGTLTDFLGTMLANETKTAFFTVDVDSKAQPAQYNLDLRFDWTQDNNALDNTLSLTLTVESPSIPVTLIVVAIIVVAGIGGYMLIRRRRMKAASQTAK
jgi:hypothetical protein